MTQRVNVQHLRIGDRINDGDTVYDICDSALAPGCTVIAAGRDGVVYAQVIDNNDSLDVDRTDNTGIGRVLDALNQAGANATGRNQR